MDLALSTPKLPHTPLLGAQRLEFPGTFSGTFSGTFLRVPKYFC
jgi:hypothetical protein